MNDQHPRLYRYATSPATREVVVLAALLLLAVSQARTVHDWTGLIHPSWPGWALWAAAAGYELGIVAVGLVLSDERGRSRWLWAGEALLLGASMLAAFDLVQSHGEPWYRAAIAALLPLQYLVVILAGHHLAVVTEQKRRTRAVPAATPAPLPDTRPAQKRPADRPTAAQRMTMSERVAQLGAFEREFPGAPDADLARHMGVEPRTVRRIRQAARESEGAEA